MKQELFTNGQEPLNNELLFIYLFFFFLSGSGPPTAR